MSSSIHTIQIFKQLVDHMPPLVPDELVADVQSAYEQAANNMTLSVEALEETMIVFGKKLWPYREAFFEFYRIYEGELGERFLLQKLHGVSKKHVQEFFASGGTFRSFYRGADLHTVLTPEDRQQLCEQLVGVDKDLWNYTVQRLLSTEEVAYQKKIEEFTLLFADMEQLVSGLHAMAEDEQEHPELAGEIREHIRSFEYGVSLLGPKMSYEALCEAPIHFIGRKKDKYDNRHLL
ncbi:hypothetical protein KKG22_03875 [Patescibacteria group bacterium]|nr:hypothetical protein [Patescibacteria group bacterium]MBU1721283.1 hypothetical protein [Patescibacteria group bacterium]MBU1901009.1 hypothetical protein [Patescibacteria group bacterium]